jgi:hypothetical protein
VTEQIIAEIEAIEPDAFAAPAVDLKLVIGGRRG